MSISATRVLAVIALIGAIGLVVAAAPVGGQSAVTFVDSNLTEDTTWTAEDGPYRVVGNVTVASNATLTIRQGTTVEFAEGVTLSVAGDVDANGTESSVVRLIGSRPASTAGSWGSIRTVGSGSPTVSLAHTEIAHATQGISVHNPDSTVRVSESTFASIDGTGIAVRRADGRTDLTVRESRFQNVEGGIAAARTAILPLEAASSWSITDTTFEGVSETGIRIDAERITRLTVRDNRFEDVEETGVDLESERIRASRVRSNEVTGPNRGVTVETADVSDLSFLENEFAVSETAVDLHLERNIHGLTVADNHVDGGQNGVAIEHDPRRDGFFSFDLSVTGNEIRELGESGLTLATSSFSDSSMAIRNNTVAENGRFGLRLTVADFQDALVADNRITGNGRSGLSMAARSVRGTAVRGNTVRDNGASGIEIRARSAMERVAVTGNELLDNAREGLAIRTGERTDAGYTVTENVVAANAYGIALAGPQTGNLSRNAIVFNTVEFGALERRADADPGVGVLVTEAAADVELNRNDVYGNRVGLQTIVDGTVTAKNNYWGAASGPYHRSINPEGEGNAVVTEEGWVELIEVRSDPVGETYARPTASLAIDPQPGHPGQEVTISGAESADADGTIERYRFTIDGRTTVGDSSVRTATFEENGSYEVSLWVEDDMGIESAEPATGLVRIEPEPTTREPTTREPTTAGPTTTSTPTPPDADGSGLLGWIGAGLGAVFYGIAVVFGVRGMYETLTEKPLTVRGRRIQVLAFAGIGVWAVASFVGPRLLGTVALVSLALWLVATGAAFALVKLRSD
ncbi:MAG: right-handed parallel beta-helix repeat-containing protein [Halodesulfurarchaeum sp.]